jgi:hypothetical protein
MRKFLTLVVLTAFFAALPASAQNTRVDGIALTRSGQPAPGATVAVCSQVAITAASESGFTVTIASTLNPSVGSIVTITGITPLAYNGTWTVVSSSSTQFTYANTVSGIAAATVFGSATITNPGQSCAPLATLCSALNDLLCGQPNPVQADGLGNYHFYIPTSTAYTLEIYGSGLIAKFIPDQMAGGVDPCLSVVNGVLVTPCTLQVSVPGGEGSLTMSENGVLAAPQTGNAKFGPLNGRPHFIDGTLNQDLLAADLINAAPGTTNAIPGLNSNGDVAMAQLVTNPGACNGTVAVLGNNTCGTLSASLPTSNPEDILAGPTAYGASPAPATNKPMDPRMLPATFCAVDHQIISSAVDANGRPNFLATSGSTSIAINGGTTSLTMCIGGKYQVLSSNVTPSLTSTAGIYFVFAKQDVSNASLVVGDFGGTLNPPSYAYIAPTCPSNAGTQNSYWFDLSSNTMKVCTVNSGSYAAASPPVIFLGVADNTGAAIDQVIAEPYRLDPYRRFQIFRDAADGSFSASSGGTSNKSGEYHYSSYLLTGTATQTPSTNAGLIIYSQNPVILMGSAMLGGAGQGFGGATGGVNNGPTGVVGGFGGAGGGGGGGTGKTGGAGGPRSTFASISNNPAGGAGGAAGANNGTAGSSSASSIAQLYGFGPFYVPNCAGSPGGAGGGDGTNAGASGGGGGDYIQVVAPALLVAGTAAIRADGAAGANGAAGNVGGGGGGGGGCVLLTVGYANGVTLGTNVSANGGAAGTHFGTTVGDGAAGGTGIAKLVNVL